MKKKNLQSIKGQQREFVIFSFSRHPEHHQLNLSLPLRCAPQAFYHRSKLDCARVWQLRHVVVAAITQPVIVSSYL